MTPRLFVVERYLPGIGPDELRASAERLAAAVSRTSRTATRAQAAALGRARTLRIRGTLFAYDELRNQVSRSFVLVVRASAGPTA
jgi:hypothetical protein